MAALSQVVVPGEPKLPRQTYPFPELPTMAVYAVQDDEIDHNGHVNNACYLDWSYELMNPTYVAAHPMKSFWIQYSKELLAGDVVERGYSFVNHSLYVQGTKGEDISFLMKMEFAE